MNSIWDQFNIFHKIYSLLLFHSLNKQYVWLRGEVYGQGQCQVISCESSYCKSLLEKEKPKPCHTCMGGWLDGSIQPYMNGWVNSIICVWVRRSILLCVYGLWDDHYRCRCMGEWVLLYHCTWKVNSTVCVCGR